MCVCVHTIIMTIMKINLKNSSISVAAVIRKVVCIYLCVFFLHEILSFSFINYSTKSSFLSSWSKFNENNEAYKYKYNKNNNGEAYNKYKYKSIFVHALKSSRFVKEFDEELLETQWEKDEEEEDLMTKEYRFKQEMKSGSSSNNPMMNFGSTSSPKMFFVELSQFYCESMKESGVWSSGDTSQLGVRLKEQLISGGLDVDMYPIEQFTLLAKCEAKDAKDVKNFLLTQSHVSKVTLDSKDYYPKEKKTKKKSSNSIKKKNSSSKKSMDMGKEL